MRGTSPITVPTGWGDGMFVKRWTVSGAPGAPADCSTNVRREIINVDMATGMIFETLALGSPFVPRTSGAQAETRHHRHHRHRVPCHCRHPEPQPALCAAERAARGPAGARPETAA